jgi:glycosyltransferase involved in cell wall biosynthesis
VKAERVDIIHAHTRVSQVASLVGSKLAAVPFVTTCHGYFRKRMRALVDSWGAKVVAISAAVRSHLTDDLGVRPERIELIYSGVDAAAFAHPRSPADIAETRKRLGLGAGPVVGTIGRLSPVKGQRYMVGAMKAVIEKRPDCQAVLLGEGTEEPSLRALAASLGISDAVHFYPSCPDTAKFLSIMDVFVFPSVKEGLGIALLEALASGRACVASSIGGIEDILTSGHDGMLVDVGDQKAISDAVLDLLSDGDLRAKMGERGRALVRERFTVESMAERMEDMYRRVLFR